MPTQHCQTNHKPWLNLGLFVRIYGGIELFQGVPCSVAILRMDEILYQFETMGNHCLLVFTGELASQGFVGRLASVPPRPLGFHFLRARPMAALQGQWRASGGFVDVRLMQLFTREFQALKSWEWMWMNEGLVVELALGLFGFFGLLQVASCCGWV